MKSAHVETVEGNDRMSSKMFMRPTELPAYNKTNLNEGGECRMSQRYG
jgi:hypothetical protein